MKNAKIVLVAEWTGWCGSCTAERPLVLTRSGGQGLRAWLTARSAPDELLVLTCRLCGVGGPVPSEEDDPEVLLEDDAPALPSAPRALLRRARLDSARLDSAPPDGAPLDGAPLPAVAAALPAEPLPVVPPRPDVTASAEVLAARQLVGAGLAALLARRSAQAQHATVPLARVASAPVPVAPPLPLPRTSPESVRLDGIEALQLLAEGIDLLAPSRP